MLLARVNCADWSHVCTKQNVTEFPVVKMYKEGLRVRNPATSRSREYTEGLVWTLQVIPPPNNKKKVIFFKVSIFIILLKMCFLRGY